MLVLSRREQEAIVFPKLGIRIEITRLRGKAVSLGIEAPDAIRVLRGEIATAEDELDSHAADFAKAFQEASSETQSLTQSKSAAREREHELRNRINTLTIALHLLKKNAARNDGLVDDSLLNGAIDELSLIEDTLHDTSSPADLNKVGKTAAMPLALIIDDNENENALMSGFLRSFGFRVAVALDGNAALRLMQQAAKLPDIVLLDMNMPGLNGRGTIEAIRQNPKTREMKVFAVSGEDQAACDVPIGDTGVDRWFRKPIRPDHLVEEMAKGIQKKQLVC